MARSIVDFSLRPNKAIERKLIFEALASMSGKFSWSQYQYVGFGALWFRDFVLANRILRVKRLHSIESRPEIASRALMSRPISCIEIHEGRASRVLFDPKLRIAESLSIVWLDYDDTISAESLKDVERLCRELPKGSVIIVTLNGSARSLAESVEEQLSKLRGLFGDWVKDPAPSGYLAANLKKYPMHLGQLLWGKATKIVQNRQLGLCPLFHFAYQDGAPMVTVGGMIVDTQQSSALEDSGVRESLGVLQVGDIDESGGWSRLTGQCRIEAPVLTRLERLRFNRELPGRLTKTLAKELCGHELSDDERDAYSRYFSHYPSFAEFDL